ncbi:hypothetical protein [Mycobacterium sp. SMC-19]|uniref:hypothetical protein n=1 Tax=Mycobacterium sp. SMC-19 TaxID=3381630 RepID=UPI0038774F0E
MTIAGGCRVDVGVAGAAVVLGAVVVGASDVVGGTVVVVGGSVVVVVVGASVVEVGDSDSVAGGGFSAVGASDGACSGPVSAGASAGAVVVEVTELVAGAVGLGSLFTSRTMPHTNRAIRIAVTTPRPTSATGRRYQGVGGGGSVHSGWRPVGSRYSL